MCGRRVSGAILWQHNAVTVLSPSYPKTRTHHHTSTNNASWRQPRVNAGKASMYAGFVARASFAWIGLKIPRGSALRVGSRPTSGPSFSKTHLASIASMLGDVSRYCARNCAHQCGCARELSSRLLSVAFAHDVVAVKHRARLMARDRHCYVLRDTRPHHVPHRGAAEVVNEPSGLSCSTTRPLPRRPKIPNRFSVTMEHPRDNLLFLRFQSAGFYPLLP
jgi:hypothetical protein